MRKLLSLLLVTCFVLPLVAPLLASGQELGAGLPACCRRQGAHHCGMTMAERQASVRPDPHLSAPPTCCRFNTQPMLPAQLHSHTPAPLQGTVLFVWTSYPACLAQVESRARLARDRSRHKRGPPLPTLL